MEPYVPQLLSITPVTTVVYYPTPTSQPSAAAGKPRASATESFLLTSVETRLRQSSVKLTHPFALCLQVPFSRAVESLDNDILEAAAREADIRPLPLDQPVLSSSQTLSWTGSIQTSSR